MPYIFTSNQRAAIASLLIEIANADRHVAYEELLTLNHINTRLGITPDEFNTGMNLQVEHACRIVSEMTDDQKRNVARLLVEMIDADENVELSECKALNIICELAKISHLF